MLDVAGLVDAEVGGARRRRRSRSGRAGPRAWCARSRGWPLSIAYRRTSVASAPSSAVQARTHSAVSVVGASVASPPAASTKPSQRRTWPSSSAAWRRSSGRSGSASAALGADRRDRLDRVAVLARVAGQLVARSAHRRPALVEGVAKDVPPLATALDPLPDPLVHVRPFRRLARRTASITPARRAPAASTITGRCARERDNIAAPELPGRLRWLERRARAAAGRAHRGRPGARPLLRLRPAQQRPRAALRGRLGPSATATPGWPRSASTRRGFAFTGERAALGPALERLGVRHPVADDSRLRGLARLRLQGLAVAVPLGPGRGAALVSLRRGRVRGDRGGDRGGAAPRSTRLRAAGAARAAAAERRARGAGRAAERGGLPGRLADASRGEPRATARRSSSTTRPAARTPRSTARASCAWRVDGGEARRDRGRRARASTTSPTHPRHERHALRLAPAPASSVYSVSFSAGCRRSRASRPEPRTLGDLPPGHGGPER